MSAPIAVTMGDASGVGPEIILRRAAAGRLLGADAVVFGDASVLEHGRELLGVDVPLRVVASPGDVASGALDVVDLALLGRDDHRPGRVDAASGAAAREYVLAAVDAALRGDVAAVVTMPINKEATQLGDPSFVGHTELLAQRTGASRVTMMLVAEHDLGSLAVTHVSTHCALREAIDRVRRERVLDVIRLTCDAVARTVAAPRIAVCGLNPHAGEHGLFGHEDAEHVAPAIAEARAEGIDATGPHPADTVFFQAVHRFRHDAIVAMYHDQGHGPMKLLAFDRGVNVTLGLPIVRTSVDHGTAFDIAWTGQAFTESLDHAFDYARRLVGG